MRTNLNDASRHVQNRTEFRGSAIFSETRGSLYVVYSYGHHFPMYIHDGLTNTWYGNKDKYSVTTSKHQTKCNPGNVEHWLSTQEMKELADSHA